MTVLEGLKPEKSILLFFGKNCVRFHMAPPT